MKRERKDKRVYCRVNGAYPFERKKEKKKERKKGFVESVKCCCWHGEATGP